MDQEDQNSPYGDSVRTLAPQPSVPPPIRYTATSTTKHRVTKGRYLTSNDPRGYIPVYEYPIGDNWIMMDADDGYILWTAIWKALGNAKADIVKMLDNMPEIAPHIRRVRGGYLKIQGTWMKYDVALTLSRRVAYPIAEDLIPIFGPGFPETCLQPDQPGYGQLLEGKRRRRRPQPSPRIIKAPTTHPYGDMTDDYHYGHGPHDPHQGPMYPPHGPPHGYPPRTYEPHPDQGHLPPIHDYSPENGHVTYSPMPPPNFPYPPPPPGYYPSMAPPTSPPHGQHEIEHHYGVVQHHLPPLPAPPILTSSPYYHPNPGYLSESGPSRTSTERKRYNPYSMPPPRKDDGRLSRLPYNLPPVDYSRIHLPPIKSSFAKKLVRAGDNKSALNNNSQGNESQLDPLLLSQGEHSYSGSGEKLVVGLPISSARDDDNSGNVGKDELNEVETRGDDDDDTRSEHSDDRSRSRSPA